MSKIIQNFMYTHTLSVKHTYIFTEKNRRFLHYSIGMQECKEKTAVPRRLFEQRAREHIRVERLQIVDACAYADKAHRHAECVRNADHHAALGRAVKLR